MSALTVMLCFCMVSPLLSLKCRQSGPGIAETECVADTSKFELCVTITETMSDGSNQVVKGCQQGGTNGCSTVTFCNDRDLCNSDTSDFSVAASVTSRSCKCVYPTGFRSKILKSPLAKLHIKDETDCDSKGECTVHAGPTETAVCLSQTMPLFPGQILKVCTHINITGWTAFPSRQTMCACDTDMCNSGGDPVVPTTPPIDKSTAAASVTKGSNTPSADVTATATSAASLCDSSILNGIVLAIMGKILF